MMAAATGRRGRRALLPRECAPFMTFVQALRAHGFAVAPEQATGFLAAVALVGPRSMEHIRQAAVATLAPQLARPCVLVGKSTVPVGTADRITARIRRLAPAGNSVRVAWSPEFLRESHAVADTLRPDRLVFGFAPEAVLAAFLAATFCGLLWRSLGLLRAR